MTDPRELYAIPRVDVDDPAGALAGMRAQAEALAAARQDVEELVGTAESTDGLIRATVGPEGLRDLVLEPKAMRLPSADLAEAIVALSKRATDDLAEQRRQRLADAGVTPGRVDLDESRAKIADLEALVRHGGGDMQAVFERFRRQIGL